MASTRAFSNISNISEIPRPVEGKRITRASRKALADITSKNINLADKENVQAKIGKKTTRQTKVAARRLPFKIFQAEAPMEVEEVVVAPVPVLPAGVKDIDAEDHENPQLCSEYALETYAYLKQLEKRGAVRSNYLTGCPTNEKMRSVLIDWLVEVQIQFKLLQETLFLTVNTIDRFMAVEGKSIPRSNLQLVGVSAMFLISKIEEIYAPSISDFVYITDNAYTESEIRKMELRIIRALDFDLCQPISLNFLRRYSKAGEVDVQQHSLAKFSLEVCLMDCGLVAVPGSLLASASLCLSLLLLDGSNTLDNVWTDTLAFYSGYSRAAVLELVPKIASNLVSLMKSNKLMAVKNKYKSSKFLKVAELGELKGARIAELCKGR
jgi:hypothetical protein